MSAVCFGMGCGPIADGTPLLDADIVCARAKNHYDPEGTQMDLSESATRLDSQDANRQLEAFKASFKPLNERSRKVMYFS